MLTILLQFTGGSAAQGDQIADHFHPDNLMPNSSSCNSEKFHRDGDIPDYQDGAADCDQDGIDLQKKRRVDRRWES